MKKITLLLILSLLLGFGYSQCGCTKLVFIIDNSGSVSTTEFTDMKRSIDTIAKQLLRQYPSSEITVIQYGTQNATNHVYHQTVPFTSNPAVATTWSRAYATGGTINSGYFQDHLPGSLEKMRRDSIWYAGRGADLITGGCNARVFLFTDASYGGSGCCSHLINNGSATLALPNYGEYNLHKSTFSSEWTVYHVTFGTNTTAQQAGAAIASKGGSYTGTRALNPGDPQGAGGPRKYFSFTTFALSQQNVDTALANINAGSFSAQFPNDTICLGDSVDFSSNVTFPTSYVRWIFGDGSIDSTSLSPKHLYGATGTYQVTLIVWSADSTCKDTITKPVMVNPNLVADFLHDTVCLSNATTFTNTTTGFVSSLQWIFGDGGTSTFMPDTTRVYALPGIYPVTLITKSSSVCSDTITKNVVVNDKPSAQFSISNQCQFLSSTPNNMTTVITASLASLSWDWDFGDGGTSSVQSPAYSFNTAGSYTVELIATTPQMCADTFSLPIVINPKPVASFSADTACLTTPTTFTDLSILSSGTISSWNWTIPGLPTVQNPVYTSPTAGTFPVTLTITTDSACTDDTIVNVIVRGLPSPDFVFSPQEIFVFDTKVCFINNSVGATSYFWDFDFVGPTGTSVLSAPCTVEFPNDSERKYNVKLVGINQYACRDSVYKEVSILDGFILYAPNTFTPNGDGKNDVFQVYAEGIIEFEMFIFNRWGEEVFHSVDASEAWDGSYNGTVSQIDAYVYRIIVKSKNNKTQEYYGHINLAK